MCARSAAAVGKSRAMVHPGSGNDSGATQMLGRAVKIAHASHNVEMTQRLSKVVEVLDAPTGTVRLKNTVDKADEMALDTRSTKTTRIRREP